MRTLVITSDSGQQRGAAPDPARMEELCDPQRRHQADARLASLACPAARMFIDTQHRLIMSGLDSVWDRWGRSLLELAILSSAYGLLPADRVVIPYDVTFDQLPEDALADWLACLEIPQQVAATVRNFDLVFYLLDGHHLASLCLPLDLPQPVMQILLTGQPDLVLVPRLPNLYPCVATGAQAAQRWHVKAPYVRGFLFSRLCSQIVQHGPVVLEWLHRRPQDTELLFYKRSRWRPQWTLW